jgi:hypothetical protein
MAKPANRSQLMDCLGAEQRNKVWSWCGVNHEEKSVYFSMWTDTADKRDGKTVSYTIQEPDWGINESGAKSAARKDHDEKLSLIFDHGYQAYGYFIEPKDRNAHPREIESTRTSFIVSIRLEKSADGCIFGYPEKRIEIR